MGRPTTHERHDPGVTGGAQRSWWSSRRSGRSLLLFPLAVAVAVAVAVALCWGIVIAVFASIGRLWGPEDEQCTWGEVVGAALGNFVFVFFAAIAVSGIMRIVQNRSS